jgi:hypothetical protein
MNSFLSIIDLCAKYSNNCIINKSITIIAVLYNFKYNKIIHDTKPIENAIKLAVGLKHIYIPAKIIVFI